MENVSNKNKCRCEKCSKKSYTIKHSVLHFYIVYDAKAGM